MGAAEASVWGVGVMVDAVPPESSPTVTLGLASAASVVDASVAEGSVGAADASVAVGSVTSVAHPPPMSLSPNNDSTVVNRRVHADGVQGPLTFVCGVGILCGGFGVSLKERLKKILRERKKTPDAPS
jgi:hypothetical protein